MSEKTIQQLAAQTNVQGTDLLVIQRGSSPLSKITASILATFVASLVNVAQALGYTPLNKAGDTMTGDLTLDVSGVPLHFPIPASAATGLSFELGGHQLYAVGVNSAGDFFINRSNFLGVYEDTPFALDSTGQGTFTKRPLFGSATPWDSANLTPSSYQPALGYTPVNKAGDTMTGALTAPQFNGALNGTAVTAASAATASAGAAGFQVGGLTAARVGAGSGGNSGRITWGTGAAPTLAVGEIYLQVPAT